MKLNGGCYCGQVRYEAVGEPLFRVQCHCRECQYISGGNPNVIMGMPESGFTYTKGAARKFRRSDLDQPVTREFCPECGTHLLTRSPRMPGMMLIKVGTFDDPGLFGGAEVAIFTVDKQSFHHLPEGVPAFERRPDSYKK
ncbi:MAG: GFA family protein [Pseudomonadota bacterium]